MPSSKKPSLPTEEPQKETTPGSGEAPPQDVSFAKALKMLEEIVKALESGELSLEDSLAKFEEGITLARRLEAVLDRAEQKVREVLSQEPDGTE